MSGPPDVLVKFADSIWIQCATEAGPFEGGEWSGDWEIDEDDSLGDEE